MLRRRWRPPLHGYHYLNPKTSSEVLFRSQQKYEETQMPQRHETFLWDFYIDRSLIDLYSSIRKRPDQGYLVIFLAMLMVHHAQSKISHFSRLYIIFGEARRLRVLIIVSRLSRVILGIVCLRIWSRQSRFILEKVSLIILFRLSGVARGIVWLKTVSTPSRVVLIIVISLYLTDENEVPDWLTDFLCKSYPS